MNHYLTGASALIILVNEPLYVAASARTIPLSVAVLPAQSGAPASVRLSVETGAGQPLAQAEAAVAQPIAPLRHRDLNELLAIRKAVLSGQSFRLPEAEGSDSRSLEAELEHVLHALEFASVHLDLPAAPLLQSARPGETIRFVVRAEYSSGGEPVTETVYAQARVRALPAHPQWYAGDAHVHAAEFDPGSWLTRVHRVPLAALRKTAESRGHHWLYMTEHTDNIERYGFDRYYQRVQETSLPHLPFLPGGEVQVRYDGTCDSGHLTVYGIRDLTGLQNEAACNAQMVIDAAEANHPGGPSSGGIAHPVNNISSGLLWKNWTVQKQRGMELMNGVQIYYHPKSLPVRTWVEELERTWCLTLREGWLPSARAVTDVHTAWHWPHFVTWVHLPGAPGFTEDGWENQHRRLNEALYYGRTVASSQGDLSFFTIGGQPPGSILRLPDGEPLELTVWSQAVNLGQRHRITVEIYERTERILQIQSPVRQAGAAPWAFTLSHETSPTETYYRLQARYEFFDLFGLVDREAWVYTSPIYVGRP